MKSRFREYRQRLAQNQRRAVTNADPYRDVWGRFSTAREATETAIRTTLSTAWGRVHFPNRMDGLSQGSQREGSEHSHNSTASIHGAVAEGHGEQARNSTPNSEERRLHLEGARLHNQAATTHWQAAQRLRQADGHPNPGFDLSDKTQRLMYADWLEDRGHDGATAHLRLYSV